MFTKRMCERFVELVVEHSQQLFPASRTAEAMTVQAASWRSLAAIFNAEFSEEPKTITQMQVKWKNLKQQAKFELRREQWSPYQHESSPPLNVRDGIDMMKEIYGANIARPSLNDENSEASTSESNEFMAIKREIDTANQEDEQSENIGRPQVVKSRKRPPSSCLYNGGSSITSSVRRPDPDDDSDDEEMTELKRRALLSQIAVNERMLKCADKLDRVLDLFIGRFGGA